MTTFLMILFLIVCVLLILIVLLQKGRGGGLGAAFGGAGTSAFGTRTGDVLTWVTIVLTGLFLLLAVLLVLSVHGSIDRTQVKMPVVDVAGPITQATVVKLSCGTKGAEVRYTVNGKDPTDRDILYKATSGGVKVQPGDVLKARAFRAGCEDSKVLMVEYKTPESQPVTPELPAIPQPESAPATMPAAA